MKSIALILLGGIALASTAAATPLSIAGFDLYSSFWGTLDYHDATGQLVVDLLNTSDGAYGGFLTAIALRNPALAISGITFSSTNSDFALIGGPVFQGGVAAQPFAEFDFGASATGGNWTGGGQPRGLAPGQSATFVFTVLGLPAGTTSEMFVLGFGDLPFLAARFRGLTVDGQGSSGKVAGLLLTNLAQSEVPEPATLGMLGMGLLGVFWLGRRRSGGRMSEPR